MGLLDGLIGQVAGALSGGSGGSNSALKNAALELLANKEHGGLAGMADKFKSQGLGDLMSSWIGTGQNMPANAQQIAQGLGPKAIEAISKKTGLSPDKVSAGLALVLPLVVDRLTPKGKVPESSALEQGLAALKNLKF